MLAKPRANRDACVVILAGDVGGTKTVLALFERGGDAPVEPFWALGLLH